MNRDIKTTYSAWIAIDWDYHVKICNVNFGISKPRPADVKLHTYRAYISNPNPMGIKNIIKVSFEIPGLPLEPGTVVWIAAALYQDYDEEHIITTEYFSSQEEALNIEKVEIFKNLVDMIDDEIEDKVKYRAEIIEDLKNGRIVSDWYTILRIELP